MGPRDLTSEQATEIAERLYDAWAHVDPTIPRQFRHETVPFHSIPLAKVEAFRKMAHRLFCRNDDGEVVMRMAHELTVA